MTTPSNNFDSGDAKLSTREFLGYPPAIEHIITEEKRTKATPPVLRGSALKGAAWIIPKVPGLTTLLYKSTNWPKLRQLEGLSDVYMRYDPLVIPIGPKGDADVTASIQFKQVQQHSRFGLSPYYSIIDYYQAYESGRTTPTEVVNGILAIIRPDGENTNEQSKSWLDVNIERIIASAAASTKRWKDGKPLGLLDGVPTGVKDELDLKGYYKKCVGTPLQIMSHSSDTNSWCCEKAEEAGAIILGKTNMHEIGMDTSNNNPNYGTPINPYNSSYYSGGSSGGSASAVGSGVIPFAFGCDGGGSIRLPGSWCGVYGLKTTHGWLSTRPYATRGKSVAVAGPIAANMVDLEVSWRVMSQPDPEDPVSCQFPNTTREIRTYQKRLGVCKAWFDRADPSVKEACQNAINYYVSTLGYEIIDITMPYIEEGQMAHAVTILNEAVNTITPSEKSYLTPPSQILISLGQATTLSDFLAAQRVREIIMEHLAFLFRKYPDIIIVTPTTPNAGWAKQPGEEKYGVLDGNQSVRNMEYVWLANFTGLPSISIPVGYVDPIKGNGRVPVGLMGASEWASENLLIDFGYKGEEYLRNTYIGGRVKPGAFIDVFELASKKKNGN